MTSDDVFVIVDVLNGYAISNNPVTQKPKAVQVTLNEAGNELTSTVIGDSLKWKVSSDKGVYVFTSNANSENVLYWAGGKKTDIKIGKPTSDIKKKGYHKFVEATSSIYSGLKTQNATRYICNYSNEDWRCYEGGDKADGNNLKNNKTKLAYFKYVYDTRTATNVTFGADVDGEPFNVTEGEESSFSGKTATEKDGVAGTIKYSSNNTAVVSVDETTGAVTFNETKTFGTATITALFTPADVTKYKESSASYTINYKENQRITTTIVFSADAGSFDGLGAYDESKNKAVTKTFKSASGKQYSFSIFYCTKASGAKAGCLQMKSNEGYVTSPSFETSFPYGYKVAVYYTTGTRGVLENLTISSNPSLEVKSTTEKSGGGTADDPEYVTTISLPDPSATFTMTANSRVKYVSRIELTPLAAPEIETVTLDETTNNDDAVIKNEGKTVNVTLKRTISDTYLNPFCVPFDMTADQITAVFGEGSVVSAFTSVTGKVMNFGKVTTITAGQPYIVQATKASTEISLDKVEMKFEPGSNVEQKSDELSMSFNGIVSPYTFKKNDGTELFLDKNGNLRYPSTLPSQMKGMRAYFEVLDGTSNEAKVNIGGGLSSIDKLMNGEAMTGKVYNLNGQYVGNTLDGLAKGLYIMNGKKYVVK